MITDRTTQLPARRLRAAGALCLLLFLLFPQAVTCLDSAVVRSTQPPADRTLAGQRTHFWTTHVWGQVFVVYVQRVTTAIFEIWRKIRHTRAGTFNSRRQSVRGASLARIVASIFVSRYTAVSRVT